MEFKRVAVSLTRLYSLDTGGGGGVASIFSVAGRGLINVGCPEDLEKLIFFCDLSGIVGGFFIIFAITIPLLAHYVRAKGACSPIKSTS